MQRPFEFRFSSQSTKYPQILLIWCRRIWCDVMFEEIMFGLHTRLNDLENSSGEFCYCAEFNGYKFHPNRSYRSRVIASPTEWSTNYLQTVEMKRILHCGPSKIATHNYTMLIMYYWSQNDFDDVTIIFMEEPVFKNGYANPVQQRQQDTQVHVRLNGYVMYFMCLIFKIPKIKN